MTNRPLFVPSLLDAVGRGDQLAVARAITLIERATDPVPDLLDFDNYVASDAHVIGLTGAPGVGKSTAISRLVHLWRQAGLKVAVVAVDPSSRRTGGAVLGDRARMDGHADDPGVFIRSMATRGQLGGLSRAVPCAVQTLMLAGYDRIVLETVGVGQSEIEVSDAVDTTCVLLAPGMGDALQAVKAGVMEIGDVMVVTKSDLAGADDVHRGLRIGLGSGLTPEGWRLPVISTSAASATGFEDVIDALDSHLRHSREHDLRRRRIVRSAARLISEGAIDRLRGQLSLAVLDELVTRYVQGELSVSTASHLLAASLHSSVSV